MSQFNEDNTVEQLFIDSLKKNGWKYIPADKLPRDLSDVIVEPMVKDALIRLNPEIAEDPSRADEVIYKLRTMLQPFPSDKQKLLVEKAVNEGYKKRIQELKAFINDSNNELTEYDDKMVRKYIKEIRVFDDRFHVFFKAGIDVEITR